MRIVESPQRLVPTDGVEAAPGRSEVPASLPIVGGSLRSGFNLARPWNFPGAHADSFLLRQHSRSRVQVPVEISLNRADGSSYDKGTGLIRNLSHSGLCLGDVQLSRGRLLASCFGIGLRPVLESPDAPDVAGRILRTFTSGMPAFGIEFLVPGSGAEERLRGRR